MTDNKCNDLNLFLDIYPMGKGIACLYKENEDCGQFKETTPYCGILSIYGIPYGEYRLEINQEGCEPCSCYFTVRAWGVFPMSPQLSLKKYYDNLAGLKVELEPEKEDDNMNDCECDYGKLMEENRRFVEEGFTTILDNMKQDIYMELKKYLEWNNEADLKRIKHDLGNQGFKMHSLQCQVDDLKKEIKELKELK